MCCQVAEPVRSSDLQYISFRDGFCSSDRFDPVIITIAESVETETVRSELKAEFRVIGFTVLLFSNDNIAISHTVDFIAKAEILRNSEIGDLTICAGV